MTSVEKVLKVLKERHIAVSRMERDLGFGNGYIRQLKKGTIPFDRLLSISSYLDVSINDILEDGQPHLLEMKEAATQADDGLSDEEQVLIRLFRILPAEHRAAIIRRLQELERLQKAQDDLLQF